MADEILFDGDANVGGDIRRFRIVLRESAHPIHGGTWDARYDQARGLIDAAEADRRVAAARISRKRAEALARRPKL